MDSPRARPPGSFNWVATLWHETHPRHHAADVDNRAPRWVSEGSPCTRSDARRPEWGRESHLSFAQDSNQKILPLKDLNAGFTDPQSDQLAYYQSSLLIEHIVDTYGEPAFTSCCARYGEEGVEGEEALTGALGVSLDELEAAFQKKLDKDIRPLAETLDPRLDSRPARRT